MRQKRISDYGYRIGHHENGPRNKITDVPGVRVGHATVESGNQHTGVTVIVPGAVSYTHLTLPTNSRV